MANKENKNNNNGEKHPVLKKEARDIQDKIEKEKISIPEETPVLPVKDTVVFPNMVAALSVFTERDLKLLNDVLAGNRFLTLVTQKDKDIKVVKPTDLYEYATVAVVLQMLRMPDNSAKMLVQGIQRVKIDEFFQTDPYFKAHISTVKEKLEKKH